MGSFYKLVWSRRPTWRHLSVLSLAWLIAIVAGCGAPDASNIALRKQLQGQETEINRLKRQREADLADASARSTAATSPAALPAPFETLFTAHGIRLGRLTKADASGVVVRVTPFDEDDDDLKASGTITVSAYDLSGNGERVGHWHFDVGKARPLWNGNALRYEYVVPCPWQTPPTAKSLTVKVEFCDALTGRTFEAKQDVPVGK